jgi:hypothetical protein
MTRSQLNRVRFVTGGPARQNPKAAGFTKQQIAARKPLLKLMGQLGPAVKRGDWPTARALRSAAWDEVSKLADNLTVEERKQLWKYKQRILAGEARERRVRKKA